MPATFTPSKDPFQEQREREEREREIYQKYQEDRYNNTWDNYDQGNWQEARQAWDRVWGAKFDQWQQSMTAYNTGGAARGLPNPGAWQGAPPPGRLVGTGNQVSSSPSSKAGTTGMPGATPSPYVQAASQASQQSPISGGVNPLGSAPQPPMASSGVPVGTANTAPAYTLPTASSAPKNSVAPAGNAYQDWAKTPTASATSMATNYPGLPNTDLPAKGAAPVASAPTANQNILSGLQNNAGIPQAAKPVMEGIDPKYAPFVQASVAGYNEQVARTTQEQQNVQDARNIYSVGEAGFQANLDRVSQLAAENQVKVGNQAGAVMDLAAANHDQVLQRGQAAVSTLQQGMDAARGELGTKMDAAKLSAEQAWQKAEVGLAADMVAARGNVEEYLAKYDARYDSGTKANWERFDKYSKDAEIAMEQGIGELKALYGDAWGASEQRLEDSINMARENVQNLTADRIQASAAGINASYDDAIRKAKAEANLSGDPAATAKVAKLQQLQKQAIGVEVSKARVKYEDASTGIDVLAVNAWSNFGVNEAMAATSTGAEIMKATNAYGLQRMTLAANMGMRESEIMAALNGQGLGIQSNLESQGLQLSADMRKQRATVASQLGLTEAQLAADLEKAGLQITANVITTEDMYAGYSGKDLVNAGIAMTQLSQQADYSRTITELSVAQLKRQGYSDFANFIQNSPVVPDSSLSMLLTDLAGFNTATTWENEAEQDQNARAAMKAYAGVNWGQYAPTQDTMGPISGGGPNVVPTGLQGTDRSAYNAAKKANENPMPNQNAVVQDPTRAYA